KLVYFFLVAVLFATFSPQVNGHGRLIKPPSRSSVWRLPEFVSQNPAVNYNDNQLFCGGIHQVDDPGLGLLWVCGRPFFQQRNHHMEGRLDRLLTFEGFMGMETSVRYPGQENQLFKPTFTAMSCGIQAQGRNVGVGLTGIYRAPTETFLLGLLATIVFIQWNYRAGNNWGVCADGTGKVGCGPQETFRGCADISIS
ncbi:hypothetical protein Ocin01_14376, partial [Orchesella cincta]